MQEKSAAGQPLLAGVSNPRVKESAVPAALSTATARGAHTLRCAQVVCTESRPHQLHANLLTSSTSRAHRSNFFTISNNQSMYCNTVTYFVAFLRRIEKSAELLKSDKTGLVIFSKTAKTG
jgi:hypothetical protein